METPAPHILIVDDDSEIRDLVSGFLKRQGFRTTTAADGKVMRAVMADGRFDLVLLDLMLPGEDGLTLCRHIRSKGPTPIIMVTAMGETTDKIIGLEVGADDYLPKPFNTRELLARIRAVLRRAQGAAQPAQFDPENPVRRFEGYALDLGRRSLTDAQGEEVELTAGEYDLLVCFVERPHRVLSRDQLLDLVKGREAALFDRSIDAQVSRLRRKIEPDPANPSLIKTVRAGGYVFASNVN
jgi:two-component system OmpR family response regulator